MPRRRPVPPPQPAIGTLHGVASFTIDGITQGLEDEELCRSRSSAKRGQDCTPREIPLGHSKKGSRDDADGLGAIPAEVCTRLRQASARPPARVRQRSSAPPPSVIAPQDHISRMASQTKADVLPRQADGVDNSVGPPANTSTNVG